MSLKRTPPASPAPPAAAATTAGVSSHINKPMDLDGGESLPARASTLKLPKLLLHGSSSEPNLTDSPNSLTRRKRPHSTDLHELMDEMRNMFKDFKDEQSKRFDQLCSIVEDVRSTVDFWVDKHDQLQTRVEQLEVGRMADAQHIKTLEDRLDYLERGSRSTCLEVRNFPTSAAESKSALLESFIRTCKILNVPLEHYEVKDIFRMNNSKDPAQRTIIVDLTSCLLKEKVITMYRRFNKGTSKLSTEHLRMSGPPRPIFISENLSSKMKRLFYLAREFAKANDFMFCWVSHGKIFLRKRENGPLVRVTNEADLENIKSFK